MHASRANNPLFGPNRFKLGVFSANCDGGLTMSLAPERWRADWDDIVAMTRIADEAGMEFILPVAKWRGFQGKANIYGRSFETLTHGAALGALTKRIAIFSTVHVPLVTPAFGAKAIATIDHVTHGRAGLNIVCGWNQEEFDLHGVTIDQDRRYEHGLEWFRVWSRLLRGRPGVRLGRRVLSSETTADRSRLGAAAMAGGDVRRLLAEGPRLRRAGGRCAVHHDERAGPGPCPARRYRRPRRALRPARRYLHHVARGVPADAARGGGILSLLRRGDGGCGGPGLLPSPARAGGEGRGRQRNPPPAGQPLHARLRQAL